MPAILQLEERSWLTLHLVNTTHNRQERRFLGTPSLSPCVNGEQFTFGPYYFNRVSNQGTPATVFSFSTLPCRFLFPPSYAGTITPPTTKFSVDTAYFKVDWSAPSPAFSNTDTLFQIEIVVEDMNQPTKIILKTTLYIIASAPSCTGITLTCPPVQNQIFTYPLTDPVSN